jgi:hypothetical protein
LQEQVDACKTIEGSYPILVFILDRLSDIYGKFFVQIFIIFQKIELIKNECDTNFGIMTQIILYKNMEKISKSQNPSAFINNIILQFNEKSGGVNNVIKNERYRVSH